MKLKLQKTALKNNLILYVNLNKLLSYTLRSLFFVIFASEFKKFISECAYHVKNYEKNKIFVAEFQIMWYTN